MKLAMSLAKQASDKDEVPVGAVIVKEGKVLSKAYNKREHNGDATAHAEILAIRKACRKLADFRLIGCDIYVSLEPCVMCMGAILNSRIENLFFGAHAIEGLSAEEINKKSCLNHKVNIVGGLLEKENSAIVTNYFKNKRKH